MANLHLRFDLMDENVFDRTFRHLEHVPDDFREPFEKMAEAFYANNKETFESEGPGWKPLATSTKWDRVYKGYSISPILVRTGALKDSLTDPFGERSIYEVDPHSLTMGTDVKYAIYHQTGSIKVHDHPPKRSPMVIRQSLRTKWTKIFEQWLRDEVNYTG